MLAKRYELKYLLDQETAAQLRLDLTPHMQKDPFCRQSDGYLVNSLYFDSPDFEFFSQKIEGQRYRHKIRLRTYGQSTDKIYLEMKKKINNCIHKNRAAAPLKKFEHLLNSDNFQSESFFDNVNVFEGIDNILYIARQFQVVPAVGVIYHRRALIGQQDPRLRITFDERIAAQDPSAGLNLDDDTKLIFEPHLVVLEVKVNNYLPMWLARIIEKFNLHLRSISKYCHAIMIQNVNLRDMRY
ncbi:MAG: polyphosphate polymerase domain-containing protein [Planctomycetes bacterium]|nr:polyphosphate polymerase domain-containing protein [Planctomycetota bacterium]